MATACAGCIGLDCSICNKPLSNPQLLSCLHAYCLACLRDECRENSPDKYFCPLCYLDPESGRRSGPARPWHAFEKIAEDEAEQEAVRLRLAELPASELRRDSASTVYAADEADPNSEVVLAPKPPILFPCTMHSDRLADTYCGKCSQLACHKCISSFHRRCQEFSTIRDAIEQKRNDLDSIYSCLANHLALCQSFQADHGSRLREIEEARATLLIHIKAFRGALVKLIMSKEKLLTSEVDDLFDRMRQKVTDKRSAVEKLNESLSRQLEVLNFSFSVSGEGELLPYLPYLTSRMTADAKILEEQKPEEPARTFAFKKDNNLYHALESSPLGSLVEEHPIREAEASADLPKGKTDLTLTLITSFHGGTRDDVADPLLTDILLLANGDVIVADRDNRCVKKFNSSGQALTRVVIEAVPSRLAVISNGRAAVSVMNRKAIYFLSLFGTVRILGSVPVKKLYSFLSSDGRGTLVAATNQCDCVDLLTEKGHLIRTVFSQRSDKAVVSRPMYLAPITPASIGDTDVHYLITDSGKKMVFRVDQSGQVMFTVKSVDSVPLECPLGVTVYEPAGLALFADRDNNTVALMDTSGDNVRRVLGAEDGVVKPCGIYAGQRGYVALTQVDGMVKIYSAKVINQTH